MPEKKKGPLPARKASARKAAVGAPAASATEILTLDDGTQIPMRAPPGMSPVQAQALFAYLRSNPDAARQAFEQAQVMLKNPAMAQAFVSMQNNVRPDSMQQLSVLKDDPEFKCIFDDVEKEGPTALAKYWEDEDMMMKISKKLKELGVSTQPPQPPKPEVMSSLYDAAKHGDVEAGEKLIAEGADINAKNDKGVTALGIAVGFNRIPFVKMLLAKGVDLAGTDAKGNQVLHYAAGYGRLELVELLIEAGASVDAVNLSQQKPIDVATMNREKQVVEFLKSKASA